jgi:Ca2+-binding EF-hand superfamily protein
MKLPPAHSKMISREESDLLFAQLDTDGNGSLNFIEAKAGSKN